MEKKKFLLTELFSFGGKFKYLTIIGMVLSGISAVLTLFPIIYIWLGTKEIFESYPNIVMTYSLKYYAYMTVITAIVSILIYFISLICTHLSAFRIARNMRLEGIKHLMTLPLGYFDENGSGKLRRIICDSASMTESFLAHQLPDLVGALTTPVAVIIFLFVFDWKLGIISLMPIAFAYIAMGFTPNKDEAIKNYQNSLEKMNNEAVEYVRGIPVVKAFDQSIFSFKRFYTIINDYKKFTITYTKMLRSPMCFYQSFLGSASLFLVLGGLLFFKNNSNPKLFFLNFLFYLFFIPMCGHMMLKIMWTSKNITLARDALNRINSILNEKSLTQTILNEKISNYDISLENVSFTYRNSNKKTIDNVSINIKNGTTIGLVGPSGGGKSTIAMLIARFFDVDGGKISIGGIDIKDICEEELMNKISFVFQNTNLYKGSILENVREGKPEATEEEVQTALKLARCSEFVNKLPEGMNTIVGTEGIFLSGGERQRIAIARAILKDAPIILLDEATAFTDPENEREIQIAFKELTRDKTVIMIAHRLSTIEHADTIYLIENGKIKESGNHTELLELDRTYKSMWDEYQKTFVWKEKEVMA